MNNNNNKQIRVVSHAGRLSFRWCEIDEEGWADKILRDVVDLSFKNKASLEELVDMLNTASRLPVVHLNAANSRMLGLEDY